MRLTPAADVCIVLGAALRPGGELPPALARRVAHGVALVAAGRAGRLLLSGGVRRHPPAEAVAMRALALAAGLEPGLIEIEPGSRTTFDNARNCAGFLSQRGWGRALVVTDAWHLPRALYCFRRLGIDATGSAPPSRGRGRDWWAAVLRELCAAPLSVWRVERHRLSLRREPARSGRGRRERDG